MSNTPLIFWLVPVASLIALGFAWHFFRSMMKESEGTPRMTCDTAQECFKIF